MSRKRRGDVPDSRLLGLTSHEIVEELVAAGLSNWEIAEKAGVSASRVCQIIYELELRPRRPRRPPLTMPEAQRIAKKRGGFARRKTIRGNGYLYAVKNTWDNGKVRQKILEYLGAEADERDEP